jgi:hypothetical protein
MVVAGPHGWAKWKRYQPAGADRTQAGFIQDKRISWGLLPSFRETLWGIVWVMNFLPKEKRA